MAGSVRGREDAEVEHGRRRAFLRIDEIERLSAMPAVKARRRWSRGINCTSIVPAGCAGSPTAMVLVMARLREIPDPDAAADVRAAATAVDMQRVHRADEVAGDHEVVRLVNRDAVRIESVIGRSSRPRLDERRVGVVLDDASWLRAARAAHERDEKAAVAERGESRR